MYDCLGEASHYRVPVLEARVVSGMLSPLRFFHYNLRTAIAILDGEGWGK